MNFTGRGGQPGPFRSIIALTLPLLILAIGSCSNPEAEPLSEALNYGYSSSASVCNLLRLNELEAVLGRTYEPGTNRETYDARLNKRVVNAAPGGVSSRAFNLIGMTRCLYASRDRTTIGSPRTTVELGIVPKFAREVWKKQIGQYRQARKVSLGDEAYATGLSILVLSGQRIVALSIGQTEFYETPKDGQERAIRLTRRVLTRVAG